MDVKEYMNQNKVMQNHLLNFIENESDSNDHYLNFINFLKSEKILTNQDEFRLLLHFISKLSKNHYRGSDFISKIEQILIHIKDDIKKIFSNIDIFYFFKRNKRILLFLIQKDILKVDQFVANFILTKESNFCHFFYPEIKNFLSESKRKEIEKQLLTIDQNIFDDFDEKRQIGENDSFICKLIRDDSVEKFVSYITQNNISLKKTINSSIFETNSFLISKQPTFIEYAGFFGSIQIFQYLIFNNVDLEPILWLYVIHGKNPEMIHILEDNKIIPSDETYEQCLKESIKCHHNDFAKYIQDNLLNEAVENANLQSNYFTNALSYSFHYYNYEFIPLDFESNKFAFVYSCHYDYFTIANFLINTQKIELGLTIEKGLTAIRLAADKNNYKIVNFLIEKGYALGPSLFNNCSKLTQIAIQPNTNTICAGLFNGCSSLIDISIPSTIKVIEESAFNGCPLLTKILLPSCLESIEDKAFYNCSSLTEIEIPDGLKSIDNDAFRGCSSLHKINIPNSVNKIGFCAFCDCKSLEDISIPSSITIIGEGAFCKCSLLKGLSLPSSLKSIKKTAFYSCKSITELVIPSSITKIEPSSFSGCTSLNKVTFDENSSLTEIGEYAFYRCQSLKHIKIPPLVMYIRRFAFYGCSLLNKILIPSNIKYILTDSIENHTSIVKYYPD